MAVVSLSYINAEGFTTHARMEFLTPYMDLSAIRLDVIQARACAMSGKFAGFLPPKECDILISLDDIPSCLIKYEPEPIILKAPPEHEVIERFRQIVREYDAKQQKENGYVNSLPYQRVARLASKVMTEFFVDSGVAGDPDDDEAGPFGSHCTFCDAKPTTRNYDGYATCEAHKGDRT